MAAITSPSTGRRYGIAEVCRIWDGATIVLLCGRRRADTMAPVPRSVADRSPGCPAAPCWRRSAPISPVRPGTARDIARCGPDCG